MNARIIRLSLLTYLLAILLSGCSRNGGQAFDLKFSFDLDIEPGLSTLLTTVYILEDVPTLYNTTKNFWGYENVELGDVFPGIATFTSRFSDQDLDFINSLHVYVLDPTDHSIRYEAFYIDLIPFERKQEVELAPALPELSRFIKDGTVDLEFAINLRSPLPRTLDATMELIFLVFEKDEG